MSLQLQIERIAEAMPATVGVYVEKLGDQIGAEVNADRRFVTASTFKVPVMVAAMREAEAGRLDLSVEVAVQDDDFLPASAGLDASPNVRSYMLTDLVRQMIRFSDNGSTDLVMAHVPSSVVNKHLADLGLAEIHVGSTVREIFAMVDYADAPGETGDRLATLRYAVTGTSGSESMDRRFASQVDPKAAWYRTKPPNDYATPRDMGRLLAGIWRKDVASEANCDAMLEIMFGTMTPSRIRPGFTRAQPVAHKTGTLPGVHNDVGIVPLLDGSAMVVCLYTCDATDMVAVDNGLAAISEAAYAWAMKRMGYEVPKTPF